MVNQKVHSPSGTHNGMSASISSYSHNKMKRCVRVVFYESG